MWLLGILLVLLVVAVIYLWHGWYELTNSISWVPLPREVLPKVIQALDLGTRSVVYDLGCGDGRVLDAVLEAQPTIRCVGVENNWVLITFLKLFGNRRIEWRRGDLLKTDLSGASHVVTYLNYDLNARLEPLLPRGARIVCIQYPLPNRRPVQQITLKGPAHASRVFVYNL